MYFKNLTVYIEYRFHAGKNQPKWKALRARVRHGNVFGDDLVNPVWTDPLEVANRAINSLAAAGIAVDTINFEFCERLKEKGVLDYSYDTVARVAW